MSTKATDSTVELGWLAASRAARRDGFLPIYRSLKQDGLAIIDEWGFLNPDMYWRHGRGMGEPALECLLALELLQTTCQAALSSGIVEFRKESETDFVNQIVKFKIALENLHSPDSVCLLSPRIPNRYVRSGWLSALPVLIPPPHRLRLRRLAVDPALLLRTGYCMLVNEWTRHGPGRPETAEALAIFGLGALGLFPRWRCAVCFRLVMPGTTRCSLHGQAELLRRVDKKLHSRNSASARLGRRVMNKLNWEPNQFVNLFLTDPECEVKTLASILWGKQIGRLGHSLEFFQECLSKGMFPRVQALLGDRFTKLSGARALAFLRTKLDPNEWIVSGWCQRAVAAELWLEAAAELSPGRRQSQVAQRTVETVTRARALIDQGLSQKETAELLQIKPPYLSRLLKRFPSG